MQGKKTTTTLTTKTADVQLHAQKKKKHSNDATVFFSSTFNLTCLFQFKNFNFDTFYNFNAILLESSLKQHTLSVFANVELKYLQNETENR